MASENAKAVAKEVLDTVRRGEKVNYQKIQRKFGYSKRSAISMKVKETKTFQDIMNPVVEAMEKERNAILKALPKKRASAKYRDLIDAADKMTKNIQLLSGGRTSNDKVSFGWDE